MAVAPMVETASLDADEAIGGLVCHIWYNPDWEYAAPVAPAMHPQRDHVLLELARRCVQSDHIPKDLAAIDTG